ncbi:MAG: sugar ABC transporter permease [Anaerolineae bacterium]|nr:MAG: sugar ABC transporter permease [Anaerolineae bacterium]
MQADQTHTNRLGEWIAGRRGRHLREAVTAYLFLAPALLLIFVFGIFPVGFALYVSLHKWLIIRDDFVGIGNYVDAIDNLAYFGGFLMGIGGLVGGWLLLRRLVDTARSHGQRPWLLAIPGALHAAAALTFIRWLYFQMPEFLDIASKMRGLDRTRELFQQLLSEAFHAETVYPHWQQFRLVLVMAVLAGIVASALWRDPRNASYQAAFANIWLSLVVGIGLLNFTYAAIADVYQQAIESGTDPGIWPQLTMITSGILILVLAWKVWRSAEQQDRPFAFTFRILASLLMMMAGVMLIIEIPAIVAAGDRDLWDGLRTTIFFSLGIVPVQLTIALFLSVLLFQRLKGSDVFRIIYFLPYVTPAVASATVFRVMFAERPTAPINRLIAGLGFEPQLWLRESKGIFAILASTLKIEDYPQNLIPDWFSPELNDLITGWLIGPSQSLLVVIMLSVWSFVGYNVVIYLAGLGNIPSEMTEAAEIDGANRWAVFRYITFPLLSPTTYFLSLIAVMGTFKAFNTIWVLREAQGPAFATTRVISVAIFEEFFVKTRYGYASAMAFVLFAIILTLTVINNRIQGSRVFYG